MRVDKNAAKETIRQMLHDQDMCVLATAAGDMPHTSLMAYVCDDGCTRMYMVTHRETKKYHNLQQNSRVSVMVDTRMNHGALQRRQIQALTVNGTISFFSHDDRAEQIRERFVARHVHLADFACDESAVFFEVKVESFQLLSSVSDAVYLEVE